MVERYLRNPVIIIVLLLAVVAIVVYADVPGTVEHLVDEIRATDPLPPTQNPSQIQRTLVAMQATQTALARPTSTALPTATVSATATMTASFTPVPPPTLTETSTPVPSLTPTDTPTQTPTSFPTVTPTPYCTTQPQITAFDPRLIPEWKNRDVGGSIEILIPEGYDIVWVSSDPTTFNGQSVGSRVAIVSEVNLRVEGISFNQRDGHYNLWAIAFRGCTADDIFSHPRYGFDKAPRALTINSAGAISEYPVTTP